MVDPTSLRCRQFMWDNYIKKNYYDYGVKNFWLDETDLGVGLAGPVDAACGPGACWGGIARTLMPLTA